jgi:hypothetical protein
MGEAYSLIDRLPPDKALHRTAIPLHCIAGGELVVKTGKTRVTMIRRHHE